MIADDRALLNAIIDIVSVLIIIWALTRIPSNVVRVVFVVIVIFLSYYAYVDSATAFGFMSLTEQRAMLLPVATTLRFIPGGIALVLALVGGRGRK